MVITAVLPVRAVVALLALGLLWPSWAEDRVRPGPWKPTSVPKGWVIHDTDHYQVQCAGGEGLAAAVGAHAEAMLHVYEELLPTRKTLPHFVIKVFADREGFLAYRPEAEKFVAWYDKDERELLTYDTGVMLGVRHGSSNIRLKDSYSRSFSARDGAQLAALFEDISDRYTEDLAGLVAHEAWHQYFHGYTVSWVAMPPWLDEGLGDYFSTARADENGAIMVGALFADGARITGQILEDEIALPLADLLDLDQEDYYELGWARYAQGWSLVHFLMEHDDDRLAQLIPTYLPHFKKSKNFRKTNKHIFKDVDLAALDGEWRSWALALEQEDPLQLLAERFGERIGPGDLDAPQSWRDVYGWYRGRAMGRR